jgi:hypothetical protein
MRIDSTLIDWINWNPETTVIYIEFLDSTSFPIYSDDYMECDKKYMKLLEAFYTKRRILVDDQTHAITIL